MRRLVEAAVLAVILAVFLVRVLYVASLPGDRGYISDEVWYVSAARNLLQVVFGVVPNGDYAMTATTCGDEAYATYSNIPFVAVRLPTTCAAIRVGYPYPDKERILDYLNMEHPPLGKYLIGLSLLLRDEPPYWRLPSIVSGLAILLAVYILLRRYASPYVALATTALLTVDETAVSMSGIAMLDITLGLFTLMSLYAYIYGRYAVSGLFLGLAGTVKYSGFFPYLLLVPIAAATASTHVVRMLAASMAVFLVLNVPLFLGLGPGRWVDEFLGALSWHLTSRPPGPVSSNPLDWLLMRNSFILHADPDLYASGTPVYVAALALAAIAFPIARNCAAFKASLVWALSTYGGYWLVYLLGNRTLYSFYGAHFSAVFHVLFGLALWAIYVGWDEVVAYWRRAASRVVGLWRPDHRSPKGRVPTDPSGRPLLSFNTYASIPLSLSLRAVARARPGSSQ